MEKLRTSTKKYFHYGPDCWTGYIEMFTCSKTYLIAEFLFEDEGNRQDYALEFLINKVEELRNLSIKRGMESVSNQFDKILGNNNNVVIPLNSEEKERKKQPHKGMTLSEILAHGN